MGRGRKLGGGGGGKGFEGSLYGDPPADRQILLKTLSSLNFVGRDSYLPVFEFEFRNCF